MPRFATIVFAVVFSCGLLETIAAVDDHEPSVQTTTATIRGKRVDVEHPQLGEDFRRSVAVYTGLPFAQPPVGDLRYARPVPVIIEGDFDATSDDVVGCMQHKMPLMYPEGDTTILREDCLLLDVYVPMPKPDSAAVMVWIHGGGFHYGAKAHARARPSAMAALRDVIIVTTNYRLGVLGFLSTGEEAIPGNIGLLDQRQALLWVQENIAAFGGDPERVTIFGESAGSASVNAHLLSPKSAGLFSRAIMQSGAFTPTWAFKTPNSNEALTFAFGAAMGCDTNNPADLVTCLRGKSSDDFKQLLDEGMTQMLYGVAPVSDGDFLPDDPMTSQAVGAFNSAQVMIGCLRDEGNIYAMPPFLGREGHERARFNRSEFRDNIALQTQIDDPLILELIELVYGGSEQLTVADTDIDLVNAVTQFGGDRILLCPTFSTALELVRARIDLSSSAVDASKVTSDPLHSVEYPPNFEDGAPNSIEGAAHHSAAVYAYLMTHEPAFSIWGKSYTWLGATHGEDMPYVMGTPFLTPESERTSDDWFIRGRFADDEVELVHQIMKYWTNFAKTGDPNLSNEGDLSTDPTLPNWPRFSSDMQQYKLISRDMMDGAAPLPNARECYFQANVLPKLAARVDEITRLKTMLEEKNVAESSSTCTNPVSCPDQ